jgi:hypothetical protein
LRRALPVIEGRRKRRKNSMPVRRKKTLTQTKLRSAITNGKFVLANVDHRSLEMRRLRDLVEEHCNQFGGSDAVTHSERILIGRASMLTLLTEMMEQRFALEHKFDVSSEDLHTYGRTVNLACTRFR